MLDVINNNVYGHIGISLIDLCQGRKYLLLLLLLLHLESKEKVNSTDYCCHYRCRVSISILSSCHTEWQSAWLFWCSQQTSKFTFISFSFLFSLIISSLSVGKWQRLTTKADCFVCILIFTKHLCTYSTVQCCCLCNQCPLHNIFEYLHTPLVNAVKVTFFLGKNGTTIEQDDLLFYQLGCKKRIVIYTI